MSEQDLGGLSVGNVLSYYLSDLFIKLFLLHIFGFEGQWNGIQVVSTLLT